MKNFNTAVRVQFGSKFCSNLLQQIKEEISTFAKMVEIITEKYGYETQIMLT